MPRLPPSLLRRAHGISPHLAALLPACRDLGSARNELRWIREHVADITASRSRVRTVGALRNGEGTLHEEALLNRLCRRRGAGVPLQYVLGSQPFGDLEIKCRPGVLIPRPETEAWVVRLAGILKEARDGGREDTGLKVLDLCSGSGCIPLLLYSLLRRQFPGPSVTGLDIEPRAVALARENLAYNQRQDLLPGAQQHVEFKEADIFSADWLALLLKQNDTAKTGRGVVDILVSNPPYISARGFNRDTARSVRKFEPKLALVPGSSTYSSPAGDVRPEDVFYARILDVAQVLRPRLTVLEVGDLAQAVRVVQMAQTRYRGIEDKVEIEIWRDWPDMRSGEDEPESITISGETTAVRGSGHGRAVYIRHID
ncbi:S-adenosyl-L-methionine-dependent methyltransferase [Hypomontagnella submonticulosa]|nr:S-adenosyl-L-methionine-dependent methyltransferase [Hypomontagnella submonticulosa]